MIKFPCQCAFVFEVQDDTAGGVIQCPKCGRLNDVPLLSDLQHIDPDGTFKLDAPPAPVTAADEASALDNAPPAIVRQPGDDAIDLRPSFEDVQRAGEKPTPARAAPKYDPVTGELIRPMAVEPPPPVVPTAPFAKRASAADLDHATAAVSVPHILLELMSPVNILVMFIAYIVLIVAVFVTLGLAYMLYSFSIPPALAMVPLLFLVLSHYGNVIDETGREAMHELPRPLRDLRWSEDLWGPFANLFTGLTLCYLPAWVLARAVYPSPWAPTVFLAAAFAGTVFLPAVWLTISASGTVLNLRPDRLLKTIALCSWPYALTVVALFLAMACHVWGLLGALVGIDWMPPSWQHHPIARALGHRIVVFPILFIGVYLMHFVCWHLGSFYNRHHSRFPWVLQQHVRDPDRLLRRRAPVHLPPPPTHRAPPPQ